MCELNRTKVGEFTIEESITIEEIEKQEKNISDNIITIEQLFKNVPNIELNEKQLTLFFNGVKLTNKRKDGIYKIYNNNKFIGIGIINDNLLKRDIVI